MARKPLRNTTINLRILPFFIAFPFARLGDCPSPNITGFEVRFAIGAQPISVLPEYARTSLRFVRAGSILRLIYSRINQKSGAALKHSTIATIVFLPPGGLRVLHSTLRCCNVLSRYSLWLRHVYGHEVNALADEKDTVAPLRRSSRQRACLSHVGLRRGCTPEGTVAK